ncbi:hypothetical protein JCM15831A_00080 [Asaia astilbis]
MDSLAPQVPYSFVQEDRPGLNSKSSFDFFDAFFQNKEEDSVLMRRVPVISLIARLTFAEDTGLAHGNV